eukprot:TRINITY_DN6355_c0_g1_i1.p1 TRINITY_DN6355_c0_g1~~TRINITY_DN6355_c0_g1_i1.p1  ORF type:complete len:408 (-),score=124.65 TRINITY_DN6355_c0_g1_i1:384-1607(-)
MSMFSFLSRKNMPPGSPGPSAGSASSDGGAPSLDDIVADLKKEWDRRLEALSMCLDEKSQENTQLHKLLKEREEGEKQLRNKIASLEVDLQAEKDVVREHQRRLEAMTRVLEDSIMHQSASVGQLPQFSDIENEKFLTPDEVAARKASTSSETASAMDSLPGNNYSVSKSQRGGKSGSTSSPTKKSNADPEPDSSESDKKGKTTTEDKKLTESQEAKPIKRAEKVGTKKDSASTNSSASKDEDSEKEQDDPLKITPAEERDPLKALSDAKVTIFKLKKENTVYQQKNEALAESICKYESKLVKADKYFRENLLKESRRRKDAEYVAAVLKKRVTQLQFLLDEANNSQSDSDKTPRSGEISSISKDNQDDSDKDEDEEKDKKKPVKRATAKKRSKKSKDDSDSDSDDE